MSKPIKSDDFFEERTEQSEIKSLIVSKYFKPWSKIILGAQGRHGREKKIAYIDLFCGPGKYNDGSLSTPLLVIEEALKDDAIKESLMCVFNDSNKQNIEGLQSNMQSIPAIESLRHKPYFINEKIEDGRRFTNVNKIPTLLFADPWGYAGLSLDSLSTALQSWGCECIFFFNYNRINPGLHNPSVKKHMDAIFGVNRADELRKTLKPLSSVQREKRIIEEMEKALKEKGAEYVIAYPFRKSNGIGTSHHIIFATKNKKGYTIMKGIMASLGREIGSGVSAIEYNPIKQMSMVFNDPIEELAADLLKVFSGETIDMVGVYDKHNVGKHYTLPNYKKALLSLEKQSLISTSPSSIERKPDTFGDNVIITFP